MSRFYPGGLMKGLTHGAGGGGAPSGSIAYLRNSTTTPSPLPTGFPTGPAFSPSDVYPTTRGGITGGRGSGSVPSATDAGGGDNMGLWFSGSGSDQFIQTVSIGAHTISLCMGDVNSPGQQSAFVFDGDDSTGTLLFTATGTNTNTTHVDALGNVYSYASFFASMARIHVTISKGFITVRRSGTAGAALNAVGIDL